MCDGQFRDLLTIVGILQTESQTIDWQQASKMRGAYIL